MRIVGRGAPIAAPAAPPRPPPTTHRGPPVSCGGEQVRAIGEAMVELAAAGSMDGARTTRELLLLLEQKVERGGIDVLHPRWRVGNLAMPRPLEVAAALNRLRALQIRGTKRQPFGPPSK